MEQILDYKILSTKYESIRTKICSAINVNTNEKVIIKILNKDFPSSEELTRFQREYEIAKKIDQKNNLQVIGFEKSKNHSVIIFKDNEGESLSNLLEKTKLNITQFLKLAIKITENLYQIHQAEIIHKDINPTNIIYNPETKQVRIIDFGISTELNNEYVSTSGIKELEGTLTYMSPEQTGRMNRTVDYRSDLYSLGITFYKMLVEELPFQSTDTIELVHSHIAKNPFPPHKIDNAIPSVISELTIKLMAKNAEDRYQSAYSLKSDLEKCLEQYSQAGEIIPFELDTIKFTGRLQIPEKLYGRETELNLILKTFDEVCHGENLIMFVSGDSGVGKSVLVNEIVKMISTKRSYFISGKSEQFHQNTPYSSIIAAVSEFVQFILTEPEDKIKKWRRQILDALNNNGKLLIDVIPELELIIGEQPDVKTLPDDEMKNRFRYVFQRFLSSLASSDNPLVIFFDDIQWIDFSSLELLKNSLSQTESSYIYFICSFRTNEKYNTKTVESFIKLLKKDEFSYKEIYLHPLDIKNTNLLISDSLGCDPGYSKVLSELCIKKTAGNPFFLKQFLNTIYDEKHIVFDDKLGHWKFNIEKISKMTITDNVIDLMIHKIKKLPIETQNELNYAAIIGRSFDLKTLSIIREKNPYEISKNLFYALKEGIIIPINPAYKFMSAVEKNPKIFYRFQHDKIQQAGQSLVNEKTKDELNLKIGRLLLGQHEDLGSEVKFYDIVKYFNNAYKLISESNERNQLAKLNLKTGKLAKDSAAYSSAVDYLKFGIKYLDENAWQNNYRLCFDLHIELARATLQIAEFEQLNDLSQLILEKAKSLIDKVYVYEILIQSCYAQNKLISGIKLALDTLDLLDQKLPVNPGKLGVVFNFIKTKVSLKKITYENIKNLDKMSDPKSLAACRILSKIGGSLYRAKPMLMPLAMFKGINLTLKYGFAPESPVFFAGYGLINAGVFEQIDEASKFGEIASKMVENQNLYSEKAVIGFVNNSMLKHWKTSLTELINPLHEAYEAGLDTGDFEAVANAAHLYYIYQFFIGKPLIGLLDDVKFYGSVLKSIGQKTNYNYNKIFHQYVFNLSSESLDPCTLRGEHYDEDKMFQVHDKANDRSAFLLLHTLKMQCHYLFGQYNEAFNSSKIVEKHLESAMGTYFIPFYYFYDSLIRLALLPNKNTKIHNGFLKKINLNQKKMNRWAQSCAANNLHKWNLIEAEKARVFGKNEEAIKYFTKAINGAKENQYLHEEAISNELAAKFYFDLEQDDVANIYLQKAKYLFEIWGGTNFLQHFEKKYEKLDTKDFPNYKPLTKQTQTYSSMTTRTHSNYLDFESLMKASQAIAGEIKFSKLLTKLMEIVIENAGAQKGYLFLNDNGIVKLEAEASADLLEPKIRQSIPIADCENIANTVIKFVERTKSTVVLDNAFNSKKFNKDAWIISSKMKSILCLPLLNQAKLEGYLYLENNLTDGAFTPDRVEILKMLSAKIVISIENAKLYGDLEDYSRKLEQKVEERTEELVKEKLKAEDANLMKSEILSIAAHDLKNPLGAILGITGLTKEELNDDSESFRNLEIIENSSKKMLNIINQILNSAAIETGQITLNLEEVNVVALLQSVIEEHNSSLSQKEQTIELNIPWSEINISTDATLLKEVIENVLSNAIKYSEFGTKIWITMFEDLAVVKLAIRDEGPGFTEDDKKNVFGKFQKLSARPTGNEESTGLGLSIAKQFIELLGGSIELESELGRGSTFIISISKFE